VEVFGAVPTLYRWVPWRVQAAVWRFTGSHEQGHRAQEHHEREDAEPGAGRKIQ
jgi:hypothetical protein